MSDFTPTPDFEEKVRRAVKVPEASPEFIKKFHAELAGRPVYMKSRFTMRPTLKPTWAFALLGLVLAVMASTPLAVNALKRLLGYVPNMGLVENTGGLRMLEKPVSHTREGVTLTIKSVFVYEDHVELIYEVQGISPENDGTRPANASEAPAAFCGGQEPGNTPSTEGNAQLRLPDGTLLNRDTTGKYPQNALAMNPVYEVRLPADVNEMALILDCIPWARHGAAPENWEVPFTLVEIPEGELVGAPVIDVASTPILTVEQPVGTNTPGVSIPEVTMTLEKIVPLENTTLFYFSMNTQPKDPSLISIMPIRAYVIDALGQRIELRGNYTWQPYEHRVGTAFEFMSQAKPANGPLTLVVENAVAYYAPLYVDPPQATPDEMSFSFDAGETPQHGQSWLIDRDFKIAGYPIHISSAHAVNFAEVRTPDFFGDSQGYEYGYQFDVQGDPAIKMNVEMDIMSESPACWITFSGSIIPEDSSLQYTQLCREKYPLGNVRVTVRELSILIEDKWEAIWIP